MRVRSNRRQQGSKHASGAQALGEVTGLQSLGVSQCSGVTGEGLLQLLPCWPALSRLNFNCLQLTADHVGTLVKVIPRPMLPRPNAPVCAKSDAMSCSFLSSAVVARARNFRSHQGHGDAWSCLCSPVFAAERFWISQGIIISNCLTALVPCCATAWIAVNYFGTSAQSGQDMSGLQAMSF